MKVRLQVINYNDTNAYAQYSASVASPTAFEEWRQKRQKFTTYLLERKFLAQDTRVAEIAEFLTPFSGPIVVTVPTVEFGNKLAALVKESAFVRLSKGTVKKKIIDHVLGSGNTLIMLDSTIRHDYNVSVRPKCVQYVFVDSGKAIRDLCQPLEAAEQRFEYDMSLCDIYSDTGYGAMHAEYRKSFYRSKGWIDPS